MFTDAIDTENNALYTIRTSSLCIYIWYNENYLVGYETQRNPKYVGIKI